MNYTVNYISFEIITIFISKSLEGKQHVEHFCVFSLHWIIHVKLNRLKLFSAVFFFFVKFSLLISAFFFTKVSGKFCFLLKQDNLNFEFQAHHKNIKYFIALIIINLTFNVFMAKSFSLIKLYNIVKINGLWCFETLVFSKNLSTPRNQDVIILKEK